MILSFVFLLGLIEMVFECFQDKRESQQYNEDRDKNLELFEQFSDSHCGYH